jgi:glucose-6-phosphate 1-dehydrogenase
MAKKIAPALFYLFEHGKLPHNFTVVGTSRRDMTKADFREMISGLVLKHHEDSLDQRMLDKFLDIFTFSKVEFEEENGYKTLSDTLERRDHSQGKTNRLFYLAVPPKVFSILFSQKGFTDLVKTSSTGGLTARVIIEKPFGTDGASAEELEESLMKCFTEDQVYRIDHYLAKDILQGILDFRFNNLLFEDNWNAKSVESIRIRLWETLGVEGRGSFYDHAGALRDVGQNHVLEMLALVAMDEGKTPESIREKRTEILKNLKAPTSAEMPTKTFRAQYEGYRNIEGVASDSNTETYFAIRAEIDSDRWKGVPIIMEAGKRMHEQRKEIIVTMRPPFKNRVVFRMEPTEEVVIDFTTKKPGILESGAETRSFHFRLHETEDHTQYVAEYGKMILDAISGDQSLFLGTDEVAATWKFTDAVRDAWQKDAVPLSSYAPDTDDAALAADAIILK